MKRLLISTLLSISLLTLVLPFSSLAQSSQIEVDGEDYAITQTLETLVVVPQKEDLINISLSTAVDKFAETVHLKLNKVSDNTPVDAWVIRETSGTYKWLDNNEYFLSNGPTQTLGQTNTGKTLYQVTIPDANPSTYKLIRNPQNSTRFFEYNPSIHGIFNDPNNTPAVITTSTPVPVANTSTSQSIIIDGASITANAAEIKEYSITDQGYCVLNVKVNNADKGVVRNPATGTYTSFSATLFGGITSPIKPCTDESRVMPFNTNGNNLVPGQNNLPSATIFQKLPNPLGAANINTVGDAVDKMTTILMIIAVPFVTIMIMYAGFCYITAYGNPEKIKAANKRALWTLIGTLLLFGAATIGNLIIKTVQKVTTDGIPQTSSNSTSTNPNTQQNTSNNVQQFPSTSNSNNSQQSPSNTGPTNISTAGSLGLTYKSSAAAVYDTATSTVSFDFTYQYTNSYISSKQETVRMTPFIEINNDPTKNQTPYDQNPSSRMSSESLIIIKNKDGTITQKFTFTKSQLTQAGAPTSGDITLRVQTTIDSDANYYDDNPTMQIKSLSTW